MNCRDFLPAVTTGGFTRRRLARRHAARCPACAAALARHGALAQRLAEAPPLTDGQRRLWVRASAGAGVRRKTAPASRGGRVRFGWHVVACAAGTTFAAIAWVAVTVRVTPPAGRVGERLPRPPSTRTEGAAGRVASAAVRTVDPAEEWGRLSVGLDALEADLTRLRLKAERADARRQVAVVLERHHKS